MIEFEKSRPIVIVPYQAGWGDEFEEIGAHLRLILGDTAVRIDHIGSTSIPDLAAKDIIDIQITVTNLDNHHIVQKMVAHEYQERYGIRYDNFLGITDPQSPELRKRYFREREGEPYTHIHVRENGRFNQQYPLRFRDYLRTHPLMRQGYGRIKNRLAQIFPDSIEGYLYIKDPLMDMMFTAAQEWAQITDWTPDENYL